jgi:hypothetical protein
MVVLDKPKRLKPGQAEGRSAGDLGDEAGTAGAPLPMGPVERTFHDLTLCTRSEVWHCTKLHNGAAAIRAGRIPTRKR